MDFSDFEHIIRRSAAHTMSKMKLIYTGLTLFFCGLVMVFGMSASLVFGSWIALSLNFVPLFISLALIMALGVILVRSYHDEINKKEVEFRDLAMRSWSTILGTLSLFVPVVIAYLALWMAQGVFLVCAAIPFIGPFFSIIFAFIPFVLHLATLLLGVLSIYFLFCLTPTLSLGSSWQQGNFIQTFKESLQNGFTRLSLFIAAFIPLIVSFLLLMTSLKMTMMMFTEAPNAEEQVMQRFFLMLPFALLLAPSVIFFFNVATETTALVQKLKSEP